MDKTTTPNQLIVVKQLPVIEDQLRSLKAAIEDQVHQALELECTEDTYKLVKQDRAALSKKFKMLEARRIEVKNMILAPYEAFDKVYNECVRDVFLNADHVLKARISDVENSIKADKAAEVIRYFEDYRTAQHLDPEWVTWNRTGITVGMSDSKKSLMTKAKTFIDGIVSDLAMINTQENADEILVEYKKTLNASDSVTLVAERHRRMEEERARRIAAQEARNERKHAAAQVVAAAATDQQSTGPVSEPTVMEIPADEQTDHQEEIKPQETEKIYKLEFRVFGTLNDLRSLKEFLEEGGYRYDQL